MKIRNVVVSAYKKHGLPEFVRALQAEFGVNVISTGGTAKLLRDSGIVVQDVSEYTGAPELFDGRIKTLHPRVEGGILFRRDHPADVEQAARHDIEPIDMVVVNLYPFEDVIQDPGISTADAIEMIDIGGPTMIRAAAKNHAHVTVVSNPSQHDAVLAEMRALGGETRPETRARLAVEVFKTMAEYDAAIAHFLERRSGTAPDPFPPTLIKVFKKMQQCRYGENWDQRASFYKDKDASLGIHSLKQTWGKEISFNNFLDIDACFQLLSDLNEFPHACVIFKHATPNGVAVDSTSQLEACKQAFACDPLSAFGGIWGFNKPVTAEVARHVIEEKKVFVEVLLAPSIEPAAMAILKRKENMRVLEFGNILDDRAALYGSMEIRGILGGVLVQDYDWGPIIKDWDVKTSRPVSDAEKAALIFAMRVCKWTKSNSAVFATATASGYRTLGIGAGQQSRVHVVRLASAKAVEFGHDLAGSVMATDSFFPFPDGLEAAVEAGARAILCPGGSIRDADVIKRADELGAALVFTGKRVFRH